jgi:hypothetical protein
LPFHNIGLIGLLLVGVPAPVSPVQLISVVARPKITG